MQTIHLSSAGRAALLGQCLAPAQQLAAAIGDWVDRLVAYAPLLDITLNTHDVRTLRSAPIEELETVLAKSHPNELRGYGAMESRTAQVLEHQKDLCVLGLGAALLAHQAQAAHLSRHRDARGFCHQRTLPIVARVDL